MKCVYPAIFHKEDGFWVEFPDLKGCFSDGETEIEALTNAEEAMLGYLLSLQDKNQKFPEPSSLESIPVQKDSFCSFVYCTVPTKEKSVKKTLTIPERLNIQAELAGINFSQVLQDALRKQISVNAM